VPLHAAAVVRTSTTGRVTTETADVPELPTSLGLEEIALGNIGAIEILGLAKQHLSEAHYEVFILSAVEGLSMPQVAEHLGIPLGTAKSRLYYAKQMLQKVVPHPNAA
jgi:DNA-directed RNA polymerase specialized sigma24 family protein